MLNSQRGALYELQATRQSAGHVRAVADVSRSGDDAGRLGRSGDDDRRPGRDRRQSGDRGVQEDRPAGRLVEVAKQREVAQAQFALNSISGLASTWSQSLAVEHRTPDDDLAGLQNVTRRRRQPRAAHVLRQHDRDGRDLDAEGSRRLGVRRTRRRGQHRRADRAHRLCRRSRAACSRTARPRADGPAGRADAAQRHQADRRAVEDLARPWSCAARSSTTRACRTRPAKTASTASSTACSRTARTTYDRIAYQTELDKIAANVSAGTGFSLDVLSKRLRPRRRAARRRRAASGVSGRRRSRSSNSRRSAR